MFTFDRIARTCALGVLASLLSVSSAHAAQGGSALVKADGPVQQLRIYELFDGTRAAFLERFRDHAVRIMERHGFEIVAMWEARHEGHPEFVYVLQWDNEAQMRARWQAFMADTEWIDIKRRTGGKHGQMVGEIQDRVLKPIPAAVR